MATIIDVKEHGYSIAVGKEINEAAIEFVNEYSDKKICVVCDNIVYSKNQAMIDEGLTLYDTYLFTLVAIEPYKIMRTVELIHEFLLENNFTRTDLILSIGGGITGDIAGFAASTYLRGIEFIQVPTTLLSMVDSSVGGKNGVNLDNVKNVIGTVYFPTYVHIDTRYLDTLPPKEMHAGLGEVIKCAVLNDPSLIEDLKEEKLDFIKIITKSIETKLNYVTGDEYDRGKRQFLNLGHTLGHAIESVSDFRVPHGVAILNGTILMAKAAYINGMTKKDISGELIKLAQDLEIPLDFNYNIDDLMRYIEHDKKIFNGEINTIVPLDIGNCVMQKFTIDEFREFVSKALD